MAEARPPGRVCRNLDAAVAAAVPGASGGQLATLGGRLEEYVALVRRWAQTVNLVSRDDLPRIVDRHILPALALRSAVRAVPHARSMDVGSGAGLPAIPLAITLPGASFTLVESRRRRANFLRQAVRGLGLSNVAVVCSRVERYRPPTPQDLIMSRAVADVEGLARLARHCLASTGLLLVTTGPNTQSQTGGSGAVIQFRDDRQGPVSATIACPYQKMVTSDVSVDRVVEDDA